MFDMIALKNLIRYDKYMNTCLKQGMKSFSIRILTVSNEYIPYMS